MAARKARHRRECAEHDVVAFAGDGVGDARFHKAEGNAEVAVDARPTSIKTLEWERIHQTLIETDFNISEAARRLGMHRRTLARKLEKRPVK